MTLLVPEFLPVSTYTAARLRRSFEFGTIQEGVFDAGDLKVTQRAAGANKSVDIAAGRGGVRGDDTARQGIYHIENDGVVNLAVPDNTSGNPRIDQIIARIYDSSVIGGGLNAAVLELLQGTPTSGATIDNRLGAAALPASAIRLAEFPVASGFTSITTGIIRDRRVFARGYEHLITRNQNASGTSDYTTTATSAADLDGTNLSPRVECSGGVLNVKLLALANYNTAGQIAWKLLVDGVAFGRSVVRNFTASQDNDLIAEWEFAPSAGSHVLKPQWWVVSGAGTVKLFAQAGIPLTYSIRESVRQNTSN